MNKVSRELHTRLRRFDIEKTRVDFVDIVANVPNKMFLRKEKNISGFMNRTVFDAVLDFELIQAQAHYLLLMRLGVNIGEETHWEFLFLLPNSEHPSCFTISGLYFTSYNLIFAIIIYRKHTYFFWFVYYYYSLFQFLQNINSKNQLMRKTNNAMKNETLNKVTRKMIERDKIKHTRRERENFVIYKIKSVEVEVVSVVWFYGTYAA